MFSRLALSPDGMLPTAAIAVASSALDTYPVMTGASQVPFFERNCVVVEPSNAREVLATLLEPDASVTTSLSPFAMAMSVSYNAPSLVMFPCVCPSNDGTLPSMVTDLASMSSTLRPSSRSESST